MKKLFLFVTAIMLIAVTANAQFQTLPVTSLTKKAITAVNKNTGTQAETHATTPRKCGTMENLELMKQQDPTLEARMQAEEEKFNEYIAEHQYELENNKTVYTLPVVVHVIYNISGQDISDARVAEQITQTNSDWAGTNGRSMEAFSASLRADCDITLCLATKDPSGNPTTGIERRQTTVSGFAYGTGMKYYSSGGLDAWDPTKYLNIWVCNLTGGLCGFAQFPTSGINATYGVVIHYQVFGITGASPPYNGGGTLSHEFGHCFNLYHIWGDYSGCSPDDGYVDTPTQDVETYGNHSGVLTDACQSSSPGIMYMNFMDYSDDADYANMTPNQATVMQAAVAQYLTSVANNASTACSTGPAAPVAAFTWTPTSPVVNTSVQFTDQSANTPTSWAWDFGDGGISTIQTPTHTYTATGTKNVCLTATNSLGNNQTCHSVIVIATPTAGCDTVLPASFASGTCALAIYYADATPHDSGFISGSNAYLDKEKAMLYTGVANGTVSDVYVMYGLKAGTTGNTSVKIYSSNAGAPGTLLGTSATIVKSAIDTTNQGINFNNMYHFSSPVSVSNDFFVSVVLPATWANGTNELAIWGETYTCSSTSSLAYEMWSDNTWHSFTSLYTVNVDMAIFPDICITVGENDMITDNNVFVFPNPASNAFTIDFSGNQQKDVIVSVYNMIGKLVKSISLNSITDKMFIDMSSETTGIYIVNIKTSQGIIIKKLSLIK